MFLEYPLRYLAGAVRLQTLFTGKQFKLLNRQRGKILPVWHRTHNILLKLYIFSEQAPIIPNEPRKNKHYKKDLKSC
jgi:hypothetical protein